MIIKDFDYTKYDGGEYSNNVIINGDSLVTMGKIPNQTIQSIVTSPPFWNLRNYSDGNGLGTEQTHYEYIDNLVKFGKEMFRILKDDGTLWLHIGDTYACGRMTGKSGPKSDIPGPLERYGELPMRQVPDGMKKKDLIGIPYLVAFAFRDIGFYFRRDIILKMKTFTPEPQVKDRPVKSHYHMLYFSKGYNPYYTKYDSADRDVWDIPIIRLPRGHPAAFHGDLVKNCVLRTTKENDIVVDPFGGVNSVGVECKKLNRGSIIIEKEKVFCEAGEKRFEK